MGRWRQIVIPIANFPERRNRERIKEKPNEGKPLKIQVCQNLGVSGIPGKKRRQLKGVNCSMVKHRVVGSLSFFTSEMIVAKWKRRGAFFLGSVEVKVERLYIF